MPLINRKRKLLAIDTETDGVDFHHGAKPFCVVTCNEESEQRLWLWDVDPLTREPIIPDDDIPEIGEYVAQYDEYIFQNPKFDCKALTSIDFWNKSGVSKQNFWPKIRDTLRAGHLLASNEAHDLTTMLMIYCGINIAHHEEALHEACQAAHRMAQRKDFVEKHGEWMIAKVGLPCMPSAAGKVWKFDYWLPRAIAKAEWESGNKEYDPKTHPWWNVLRDYALPDPAGTLALYKEMLKQIYDRKLDKIYFHQLKLTKVAYEMESVGVSISKKRIDEHIEDFKAKSEACQNTCVDIAKEYGYELDMPAGANNHSLLRFVFGRNFKPTNKLGEEKDFGNDGDYSKCMNLEPVAFGKSGAPSLDTKTVISHLQATLPQDCYEYEFVTSLRNKRSYDTALSYMHSYKDYWVPLGIFNKRGEQLWYRIHPSLNSTGTDTLRWSSNNPNSQNISKREEFNVRYVFGPAPGRYWLSMDASNIELRIPAFEANEKEMVHLFNNPNDPPYFGSYHMMIFDTLHPEKFKKHGMDSKKVFASTWYQWTKNGNFAVQYGAQEESGTADAAYHILGAQRMIKSRFRSIEKLSKHWIEFANETGYVETVPDRSVDPDRGYPLLCSRNRWGSVKPTVPLSYHVQGTAMQWMGAAMIRVTNFIDQLNQSDKFFRELMGRHKTDMERKGFFLVMQIHDELVFDFPKNGLKPDAYKDHLPIIREIKRLMEVGGDHIGMPTPVNVEFHPVHWAEGVSVKGLSI